MKQFILPLLVFFSVQAFAQTTVYSNDFTGGLNGMVVHDVDGQTPASQISGITPTGSWTYRNQSGSEYAVSCSWYNPAGQSDDWMVTPAIALPNEPNLKLNWEAFAPDADFPDGYEVYVSTTGDAVSDFTGTPIYTVNGEENDWTLRTVDLDSYAGQTVYIAFRNNSNDQFLLLLDNIWVGIPTDLNAGITAASFDRIFAGPSVLTASIQNTGLTEITSFKMVVKNDGTEIYNTTVSGQAIQYTEIYEEEVDIDLVQGEQMNISVEISEINGGDDDDSSDNTFALNSFTVSFAVPQFTGTDSNGNPVDLHATLASGKAVVLDFFASWCGPCESSTPELNQFYVNNQDNATVLGITVEETDDNNVVNNLGWGGTYPKMAYSQAAEDQYVHYANGHGLNTEGFIPFFVMICPDTENPGNSSVHYSEVGYEAGLQGRFTAELGTCTTATSVENISALSDLEVYPNPAQGSTLYMNLNLIENTSLSFEVYDILGRLVQAATTRQFSAGSHGEVSYDISNLDNGNYNLVIKGANGGISATRFSVAR